MQLKEKCFILPTFVKKTKTKNWNILTCRRSGGKLSFFKILVNLIQIVHIKEGCNWGHGLSAAIKLGSLEKTVGTCLLRSGVYYEQSLSCRKNCTTQSFAFVGDSSFFLQKRLAFFRVPNWTVCKQITWPIKNLLTSQFKTPVLNSLYVDSTSVAHLLISCWENRLYLCKPYLWIAWPKSR